MGVLYVDDTDLMIMNSMLTTGYEVWAESQSALYAWGHLLIATGGTAKPEKSFSYLIDYEWDSAGNWHYTDVVEGCELYVPQPDGSVAPIEQLPVTASKKTLGLYTNPAGCCKMQLGVMARTIKVWTDRLSAGKLPAKWAWVSYFLQLWAKLWYGLGCNSSPVDKLKSFETSTKPPEQRGNLEDQVFSRRPKTKDEEDQELEDLLRPGRVRAIYRRMLLFLGVNKNIKSGWRHLPSTFGGVGLRQLLTEVVIARINLFIQHYSTKSNLGSSLTISLQLMQLEAGTAGCPIGTLYHPFGPLTTPCWCRSFWEALDYFNFSIHLDYPSQPLPRERDMLLIELFKQHAESDGELTSLHRCRIKWNLLFLSDMVTADGRRLESACLSPPTVLNPPRSSFEFQEERPTTQDWVTWAGFWARFTDVGHALLYVPLGKWVAPSHCQWVWFYNSEDQVIEHLTPSSITYYKPSLAPQRTRSEHTYVKVSTLEGSYMPKWGWLVDTLSGGWVSPFWILLRSIERGFVVSS